MYAMEESRSNSDYIELVARLHEDERIFSADFVAAAIAQYTRERKALARARVKLARAEGVYARAVNRILKPESARSYVKRNTAP